MKASLNLCLLFSLISPVVLLRCKECLSLESTECFLPYDQYCAPNSSCINYLVELNAFRDFSEATKSCITPILCEPGYYSFTTTGGKFIKMLVECCRTKNCNSRPLKFSSQPMEPNGLECEGCHADRGRPCNNVETVKCLGDQTKCISMNITYMDTVAMKLRVFTTKGCATPIMCDPIKVKKSMEFGAVGVSKIIANCTDAVLSPEPSRLA